MKIELVISKDELKKKLNIKDGAPGKKGDPGKSIVGPQGPEGKPGQSIVGPAGKDGSPDTGEQIVEKINNDNSGKKIKKQHIEGLAEIEDIARSADANARSFYANTGSYVYDYDLSGLLDGLTKTFTLPANARVIAVFSSSFPTIFRRTTDYTTTASTITFTSQIDAPTTLAAGQSVVLLYKIL